MTWKLDFSPYAQKETVGTVTAVYTDNGAVTLKFDGSVNLDNPASVADFKVQALKALSALAADKTAKTDTDAKLTAVETALNK